MVERRAVIVVSGRGWENVGGGWKSCFRVAVMVVVVVNVGDCQ